MQPVRAEWMDRHERHDPEGRRNDLPAEGPVPRTPQLLRQQDQARIKQEFIADAGLGRNRGDRPPVVLITDRHYRQHGKED